MTGFYDHDKVKQTQKISGRAYRVITRCRTVLQSDGTKYLALVITVTGHEYLYGDML